MTMALELPQLWRPPTIDWRAKLQTIGFLRPSRLVGIIGPNNSNNPIAVIQRLEVNNTVSGGSSLAFSSVTTTANHLLQIAVFSFHSSSASTVSSISDGVNTWALSFSNQTGTNGLEIWTTTNANPTALVSSSVTINFSQSSTVATAHFWEISGAKNSAAVDKHVITSTTGTAVSTGATATLSATNEMAFGSVGIAGGGRTLSSSAFTQGSPSASWPDATDFDPLSGGSNAYLNSNALLITTTTAQTFSTTLSTTSAWIAGCWAIAHP